MGSRFVIPARAKHIRPVASGLRVSDADEAWAGYHLTPTEAVSQSFYSSNEAWAVLSPETGEPFAMFGVKRGSMLGGESIIWLLSTAEVSRWRLAFAKRSKGYIAAIANSYGVLTNSVDSRNTESIAWLKWLGAKFDDPAPWGMDGLDFQRFIIRREAICA